MLLFLLPKSLVHSPGKPPAIGVALLAVGSWRVLGVPDELGLDTGHDTLMGVYHNSLGNLEVLFQPHQANLVLLATGTPVAVGSAAVMLRNNSGEGRGPGIGHGGAGDVQDLADDLFLFGLFDILGSELVLGHEFAGFEQRGLGLVLIRAFCQGQ